MCHCKSNCPKVDDELIVQLLLQQIDRVTQLVQQKHVFYYGSSPTAFMLLQFNK